MKGFGQTFPAPNGDGSSMSKTHVNFKSGTSTFATCSQHHNGARDSFERHNIVGTTNETIEDGQQSDNGQRTFNSSGYNIKQYNLQEYHTLELAHLQLWQSAKSVAFSTCFCILYESDVVELRQSVTSTQLLSTDLYDLW